MSGDQATTAEAAAGEAEAAGAASTARDIGAEELQALKLSELQRCVMRAHQM